MRLLARPAQVTRDKPTNIGRAMSQISSALVFGCIYWRMGRSQSSIQDRLGLLQVCALCSPPPSRNFLCLWGECMGFARARHFSSPAGLDASAHWSPFALRLLQVSAVGTAMSSLIKTCGRSPGGLRPSMQAQARAAAPARHTSQTRACPPPF